MLTPGTLEPAFRIYWDDMQRCRQAKAYWSLLHITTCLPDICAALQTDTGDTTGRNKALYIEWCDQYLPDPLLSGPERYQMRCRVLHQGRAQADPGGRYTGFAFVEPAATGEVYHKRIDNTTLVVDVGQLADEVRSGVGRWIGTLEGNPATDAAKNTERNLPSLVRVRQFSLPRPPGVPLHVITPIINRTS